MPTVDSRAALQELLFSSARALPTPEGRPLLIGITGAPGAGKSTAAALLAEGLPESVMVEGNYLLLDSGGWEVVRPLLDTCWYLRAASDADRVDRLVARHEAHGRSLADAYAWVKRSDEANARLIKPTRARADQVITLA